MPRDLQNKAESKSRRGNPNWAKGKSGNPGGRPKVALAWKERCRAFLEDNGGWDQLALIAHGLVEAESSLAALRLMAEYAYGKPQQHVDVTSQGETIKAYVGVELDKV